MTVEFFIHGRPRGKGRGRAAVSKSGKPYIYTPSKTRKYEKKVAEIATISTPPDWELDRLYELTIWIDYPDARVADGSNVLKAIEDGCNGILWDDDRQVRVGLFYLRESQPDEGVTVEVTYHEPTGTML